MTKKRGVYRTRQERPFLRATLHVPGDAPRRGHVLDLSSRGLGVQLEPATEELAPRAEAELLLEALVLLRPIRTPVRVRQWLVHGRGSRCGLEFLQPQDLERQIPYVMRRDFNRRGAPRVTVKEFVPVRVSPTGDDARLDARLVDLSVGGMRLQAREEDAERMTSWRQLRVAFSLPGGGQPLCVPADVRARHGDEVSLAFQQDLDEMRPEVFDAISEFVLERLPYQVGRARS